MVAAIGLLLLSPLLLGIALWIKLDSPGPVFFRQQRVGRFGVLFRIHKFRNKTGYHKRQGHRQQLTQLKITSVTGQSAK